MMKPETQATPLTDDTPADAFEIMPEYQVRQMSRKQAVRYAMRLRGANEDMGRTIEHLIRNVLDEKQREQLARWAQDQI